MEFAMSKMLVEQLQSTGLSNDLDKAQIKDLAAVVESGRCTYSSGEMLFHSGDKAGFFFLIESGQASVQGPNTIKHPLKGRSLSITGEQGVIDPGSPRKMTLHADSDIIAYRIDLSAIDGLETDARIVVWRNIARILSRKLRDCRIKGRKKDG
jgi:hypothetical protein